MVKIILPISLIIVLSLAAGFYFKESLIKNLKLTSSPASSYTPSNIPTKAPQASASANFTKLFKSSKTMKFSIEVPSNYTVEEKLGRVIITSDSQAKIYIDRIGTNFNNLNDYLNNLDSHNKTQILSQKQESIKNYAANIRTLKFPSGETQYVYTFYIDGWIYSIYTNDLSISITLDQIAQSFKYNP